MKVAICQTNIIWEDKNANLKKFRGILESLKDESLDLILLPEMSFTGFSMNCDVTAEEVNPLTDGIGNPQKYGRTTLAIRKMAEEYDVPIAVGWTRKTRTNPENRYSIINEYGVILTQTKIHPFSFEGEDKLFKPGTKLPTATIAGFEVGIGICYDLRFPEVFQILSRTAELIIVPANWPKERIDHWKTLTKARAIENQTYLLGVNCCGEMNEKEYSGDSIVYSPEGNVIEPVKVININEELPEEQIQIYEITNDVDEIRDAFPMKNDRRNQFYADLLTEKIIKQK